MYCSACKLQVADDSIKVCPVCQGNLQPEVEKDFTPDQGLELQDEFVAGSPVDQGLDFDPEILGLKSSDQKDVTEGVDDMRVLADLWEKEDIGADLDDVFAEAFSVETVDLIPEEVAESEMKVPGTLNPERFSKHPVRQRNLWLPILLVAGLIVVGCGWFFLKSNGVKSVAGINDTSKSPALVNAQVEPEADKAAVTERSLEPVVTPPAESETVKSELLPAAIAAVDDSIDSEVEKQATSTAEVSVSVPMESAKQLDTDGAVIETAGVQAKAESPVRPEEPPIEILSETQAPLQDEAVSEIAEQNAVPNPPVLAPGKGAAEPVPVAEKTEAEVGQPVACFTPVATVAVGTQYVVQIGSFRNFEGAACQLAKLHKKGFAAYSVQADLGDKGVWQRIFVPGGDSRSEAKLVQEKLTRLLPREESLIRKLQK